MSPVPDPSFRDAGDTAFLVQWPDAALITALARALGRGTVPGVVEVVPAVHSLLVIIDPAATKRREAEARVSALARGLAAQPTADGRLWRIPVRYDGPDLAEVAALCGLSPGRVIQLHSSAVYTVRMLGFQPGFAYMGDVPAAIRVPRRAEPRVKVPAGSVAIADDMTAVYPWDSAGGWHLLGTTQTVLFDPGRQPPALLAAGDRVEFVLA